jgi:hypothetical protein
MRERRRREEKNREGTRDGSRLVSIGQCLRC